MQLDSLRSDIERMRVKFTGNGRDPPAPKGRDADGLGRSPTGKNAQQDRFAVCQTGST
jgi:hypothetical protein